MTVSATSIEAVRLDVWLWAARFFKTRSLAKQAIDGGKIEINGDTAKPAKQLHVGDELRISRGIERLVVRVIALSEQRGSASVAQTLYAETPESIATREQQRELRRLTGAAFEHPRSRPDKHFRKLLRGFKEGLSE
jgi:ribosome-associated heat shock protein Hsp15